MGLGTDSAEKISTPKIRSYIGTTMGVIYIASQRRDDGKRSRYRGSVAGRPSRPQSEIMKSKGYRVKHALKVNFDRYKIGNRRRWPIKRNLSRNDMVN
jgi:hypothetical protein